MSSFGMRHDVYSRPRNYSYNDGFYDPGMMFGSPMMFGSSMAMMGYGYDSGMAMPGIMGTSWGAYQTPPISPFERQQATIHRIGARESGAMSGGLGLGIGSAVTLGVLGFCAGGPILGAIGAIAGFIGGGLLGFKGGAHWGDYQAVHEDAVADGKLDGFDGYQPLPYQGWA